MRLQVRNLKIPDKRVRCADTSVGDDEVNVLDALLLQLLDGLRGVRLDGGVAFEHDQLAVSAGGELGQGLGGGVRRVPVEGDDGVGGLGEVELQQPFAETAVGAAD